MSNSFRAGPWAFLALDASNERKDPPWAPVDAPPPPPEPPRLSERLVAAIRRRLRRSVNIPILPVPEEVVALSVGEAPEPAPIEAS